MVKKRSIILTGPTKADGNFLIPRPPSLAAAVEQATSLFSSFSQPDQPALFINVESDHVHILIYERDTCKDSILFKAKRSTVFEKIFRAFAQQSGDRLPNSFHFELDGSSVHPGDNVGSYLEPGENEMVLQASQVQVGGKPVIYLLPPAGTSLPKVDVSLSLVPSWKFSAIYPLSAITRTKLGGDQVNWSVSATSDGTLVDLSSGITLTYLFWEALSCGWTPPSPPLLPTQLSSPQPPPPSESFNPAYPDLSRSNSVVLPFTAFLTHLDKTLSALTLSVAAKTDFITFWLPHFNEINNKGQNVAFRFLPQEVYGASAQLEVLPQPDVVTRVFLLFKGVKKVVMDWSEGRAKSNEVDWCSVVGLDKEKATDVRLFRVLEWGGMDVQK